MTADGANTYAWNAESEIKSAAGVDYTYDGDGNRIQKSTGKLYWYGPGGEVLDETDATGSTTNASFSEYIYFQGGRIARLDSSGNVFYYIADHLGTSHVIAEVPSGSSIATLCYDADFYPYGGERAYTNNCPQNYKFMGKERDAESNLDDFGARYYSSQMGRFVSADWSAIPVPVPYANFTNPQTLNLYAIVRDNPETFSDLDGHNGRRCHMEACTQDAIDAENQAQAGTELQQNTPPPAQQQTLTNAQDAARNNPNLQPTKSGKTFCNIATCQIAKAMGAPMGALTNPKNGQPALANQIATNLAKSGSGYRQVSPQEAQQLANEGKLVIGVQPHAGHGHMVTVRPGGRGSDPLVNNIGKHVDIRPASRAFYSNPAVKYYTPQ